MEIPREERGKTKKKVKKLKVEMWVEILEVDENSKTENPRGKKLEKWKFQGIVEESLRGGE